MPPSRASIAHRSPEAPRNAFRRARQERRGRLGDARLAEPTRRPVQPIRHCAPRTMSNEQDHLHADGRGAGARDLLAAADRAGVHAGRGLSPSRRATSRSPAGSSRSFPERLAQAPSRRRRSRRARRDREDARSEHHQAAEHQRVGAAAHGRDQGAPAARLRRARLSGGAAERRREGRSRRSTRKVLGSAVNPVLREGNSDRRVAASVKQYAKKHPHSMGRWSKDSKSHVANMAGGDFYGERAVGRRCRKPRKLKIELTSNRGEKTVLKEAVGVQDGDVIARVGDEPPCAARLLREADRRRQGQGRAAVAAPQSHDDEGVGPDHVRPRRRGLLPRRASTSTPTR